MLVLKVSFNISWGAKFLLTRLCSFSFAVFVVVLCALVYFFCSALLFLFLCLFCCLLGMHLSLEGVDIPDIYFHHGWYSPLGFWCDPICRCNFDCSSSLPTPECIQIKIKLVFFRFLGWTKQLHIHLSSTSSCQAWRDKQGIQIKILKHLEGWKYILEKSGSLKRLVRKHTNNGGPLKRVDFFFVSLRYKLLHRSFGK